MTAEQLAQAVSKGGMHYTRTQVTNLEAKRRDSITIGEINALAGALNVAPALLMFPLDTGEEVELLPGYTLDPFTAYEIFTGDRFLARDGHRMDDAEQVINTYRRHDVAMREYERTANENSEDTVRSISALASVRREIRSKGWYLPPPPVGDDPEELEAEIGRRRRAQLDEFHRETKDSFGIDLGKEGEQS